MLRLRSCSKARAKSLRTSSRIWRNDARSSARRRVSVRRLTASAVATASSVRTDCPRCSTSMRRTRVLMAPALDRSRASQRVLEPAADNRRQCRIGVAHGTCRIGCAEAHRARTGGKANTSVEEPPMLRRVVRCRMREADTERCDVRSRTVTRELERHGQREFCPCRVQRGGGGVVDQKQQALFLAVCPRRHAIAQQTPIARQTIEPFSERGARSQRVLDEVERATRQRLGEMDAERFIAGEGRGETPRRLGRSLGDANARIHEPRPAEEPANRRRVDAAAFHPCDEVWQDPTLYGGRDERAPVPPARTLRPSGWHRPPFRASSPLNRAHLASARRWGSFRTGRAKDGGRQEARTPDLRVANQPWRRLYLIQRKRRKPR